MSRIGKIARLNHKLRNELGRRIEDGIPGKDIVRWLNAEPKVQQVVEQYFEGQAVTEQNLSDWKQGGHQEWRRYQAAKEAVTDFVGNTKELVAEADKTGLVSHLATMFAAELMQSSMALLAAETDPEKKWKRLCEVHRELSRLRRDEDRMTNTALKQAKWECEERRLQAEDKQQGNAATWEWRAALQIREQEAADAEKKAVAAEQALKALMSQGVKQAGANEPEQGRESGGIVANRVKKDGTSEGAIDGSGGERPAGRRTDGRDARPTSPTGDKGPGNPQESKLIVANRVKKEGAVWGCEEIKPEEVLGEGGE